MTDKKKGADDDLDKAKSSAADESEDRDESGSSGERDASTRGVAKALGVDEDEDEDADADAEDAKVDAAPNRAARRRDEVLKRRAEREGKAAPSSTALAQKTASEDDADEEEADEEEEEEEDVAAVAKARDPLPKDRNARAKELLRRRQESVERVRTEKIGLSAGELVQDQLARAASGTTRWFRANFKWVAGGLIVAVSATAGILFYIDKQATERAESSDALTAAVTNERGDIVAEGAEPNLLQAQLKEVDPRPTFSTYAARADAALVAYDKVINEHAGSGAAILAKLGKAGAHLDKGEADAALSAYGEVLTTELAKADVDVKARALEGKGFALEAKKDFDGALAAFRELETSDKSMEDLGQYHQARMHLKKGDKDKAKEVLAALYKKLELPPVDAPQPRKLREAVEQYLRSIDPQAVPKKRKQITPGQMPQTQEEWEAYLETMRKNSNVGHEDHGHADPGGDDEMPPMPMPQPMPMPEPAHDDGH